jgi:hypothetical protein
MTFQVQEYYRGWIPVYECAEQAPADQMMREMKRSYPRSEFRVVQECTRLGVDKTVKPCV